MKIFKKEPSINFIKLKKITSLLSFSACILSIIFLIANGLLFSLEFTGGTQIHVRFNKSTDINKLNDVLIKANLSNFKLQNYGSTHDIIIKTSTSKKSNNINVSNKIERAINSEDSLSKCKILKTEYIGSEVSNQLLEKGSLSIFLSIIAMMIYITLRFNYKFAISAIVSLSHDVLIVLGIFSLFKIEFDLATLAAILAILGYSINDTVIIFDRIRENILKLKNKRPSEIINKSINQTLSRTIMTSFLTLLVVVSLLLFSGKSLFGFSLALFFGIIIGTYSSIYIAGVLLLQIYTKNDILILNKKNNISNAP